MTKFNFWFIDWIHHVISRVSAEQDGNGDEMGLKAFSYSDSLTNITAEEDVKLKIFSSLDRPFSSNDENSINSMLSLLGFDSILPPVICMNDFCSSPSSFHDKIWEFWKLKILPQGNLFFLVCGFTTHKFVLEFRTFNSQHRMSIELLCMTLFSFSLSFPR